MSYKTVYSLRVTDTWLIYTLYSLGRHLKWDNTRKEILKIKEKETLGN